MITGEGFTRDPKDLTPAEKARNALYGMAGILFRHEGRISPSLAKELGSFVLEIADSTMISENPEEKAEIAPMRARIAQMTGCQDVPAEILVEVPEKTR